MASTFLGLYIGGSGLNAFQAAVNTTANNISNVQTEGYSRQTTTLASNTALRVAAKYGSVGTGVSATAISQERNSYYDTQYWQNNSSLGLYETKLYYMNQIETFFTDDTTQKGFSTLFTQMFNDLDTVKGNASDASVRNQFINSAQQLCTYFNSLSNSLSDMQSGINDEIKSQVDDINSAAKKIALLNDEINSIEIRGGKANELRDERAELIDKLSQQVNVETSEYEIKNSNGANLGGTNFTVTINGQTLVDGNDYRTLQCISNETNYNETDVEGLYSLVWSDTGMGFAINADTSSGSLKALFAMRDGTNGEALTGQVSSADKTHITLENPSITSINSLNIAEHGTVTIKNKAYEYDGWSAELDSEGNITSYTFHLTDELEPEAYNNLAGKDIICGQSQEGMGIPYYQEQINEFLRSFTTEFNDIEKSGQDLNGDPMDAFFVADSVTGKIYTFADSQATTITNLDSTYYRLTAANVKVNESSLKDASIFSTTTDITAGKDSYDLVTKLQDLQNNVEIFRGNGASSFLETLLSDITTDTEKADIFHETYSSMESTIDNLRQSVSGVDEDEEAMDLVKYQNAYNMASKVISVLSEMYDRLINETGVD